MFGSSSHCAAVCCELRSAGAVYGAYSYGRTYLYVCAVILKIGVIVPVISYSSIPSECDTRQSPPIYIAMFVDYPICELDM